MKESVVLFCFAFFYGKVTLINELHVFFVEKPEMSSSIKLILYVRSFCNLTYNILKYRKILLMWKTLLYFARISSQWPLANYSSSRVFLTAYFQRITPVVCRMLLYVETGSVSEARIHINLKDSNTIMKYSLATERLKYFYKFA